MAIKDFSILLEPVQTTSSKKDIGMVTDFNAVTQYIEHVMKTQKGELISNMDLGSNYYTYIFGNRDKSVLEFNIASYLEAAIPQLKNIKATLVYYSQDQLQFEIKFSIFDGGVKTQKNASCFIEVQTT